MATPTILRAQATHDPETARATIRAAYTAAKYCARAAAKALRLGERTWHALVLDLGLRAELAAARAAAGVTDGQARPRGGHRERRLSARNHSGNLNERAV